MTKRSRIVLFIAVAAITFAGLTRFVGPRYGCGPFGSHRGCSYERQHQDNDPETRI